VFKTTQGCPNKDFAAYHKIKIHSKVCCILVQYLDVLKFLALYKNILQCISVAAVLSFLVTLKESA
jgi:hypothetical protein